MRSSRLKIISQLRTSALNCVSQIPWKETFVSVPEKCTSLAKVRSSLAKACHSLPPQIKCASQASFFATAYVHDQVKEGHAHLFEGLGSGWAILFFTYRTVPTFLLGLQAAAPALLPERISLLQGCTAKDCHS